MKTKSLLRLVLLLGISALAGPCSARTFYVDQANPKARDFLTNGSEKVPFKTLAAACQTAGAGDAVIVKPGVYREILTPMKSGRKDAPLVFQAAGPGVWVKGSDVVSGWKKEGDFWVIRPWKPRLYYDPGVMDGLSGAPFHSSARMEQVFVNGKPLAWTPDRASLKTGGFCWAADGSEIVLSLPAGTNPNKALTEIPVRPATVAAWPATDIPRSVSEVERGEKSPEALGLPQVDWVVIRGFHFAHNAATLNRSGVRIQGRFWLLENNTVEWMNSNGIGVDDYATLRRNTTRFNGQTGMGGEARGAVLDGNTSFFDNIRDFNTSWGGAGLKFALTENMTVRNQVVIGAGGPGIWFDIDCIGSLVSNCVVMSNRIGPGGRSHGGIFYEISYNAGIEKNVLFGNHWSTGAKEIYGAGVTVSRSTGIDVSNNRVIFCEDGLSLQGGPRGLGSNPPGIFWKAFGADAYYGRDVIVRDNLVVGDLTKAFGIGGECTVEPNANNLFSNNIVLASRSSSAVCFDSAFLSLSDAGKKYPQVFSENTQIAALAAVPEQVKSALDRSATRILEAIARIEPKIQRHKAKVLGIWQFPGSASQGLFVSSGGDFLCIVDNPLPTTLRFNCPTEARPKAWIADGDYWTSLISAKGGYALNTPAGLCVVTGLPPDPAVGE